tara:strand:- start:2193 stop:3395 length:1203 start_codon:yes stop_codon:yes gene_type:complete
MSDSPKGEKVIKSFDGNNAPDDFDIPSIGIEDLDRAIFQLFDKKIFFEVSHKGALQKVPVIFASGERFALTRRKNPIRDSENTLILPLVSIMRQNIDFSPSQANKRTAISFREQENYIIKYKLSEKDRKYQNIINKQGLKNQLNVSSEKNFLLNTPSPGFSVKPDSVSTRRSSANIGFSSVANISLGENLGRNMFEIIEIPYPEFVAVTYDVVFWTQYMKQSNQMIETLLLNFTGQGEEIPITTDGGYELVAFFSGPFSNSGTNLDDFTESERIIKHSFSVTIPGYIINPKHPGMPKLLRSYISAPEINFGVFEGDAEVIDYQPERIKDKVKRHALQDLTNLEESELRRGESREVLEDKIINPFTNSTKTQFSKVRLRNQRSGETVASSELIEEIESFDS